MSVCQPNVCFIIRANGRVVKVVETYLPKKEISGIILHPIANQAVRDFALGTEGKTTSTQEVD